MDPLAAEKLRAFAVRHGVPDPTVETGAKTAFRRRARLAVRGRMAAPKIGIFETGSHRVVDVPRCLIHHPLVNEVAAELRRAIVETRTPPYSDEAHLGLLRYVQIVVERRSERAQVVLVTADDSEESVQPLATAMERRLGVRLHSLFWNGNSARTNTILGPRFRKLAGEDSVVETIGGATVFFPPGAFGQNNLDLADRLVADVHALVPDGRRILELYAGTGAIGLGLATRAATLVENELAEGSLEGLRLGVQALPSSARELVRIVPGPAADAACEIPEMDVVIVDPPRKGLDGAVKDALVTAPPAQLVYVACGLDSFLSDATSLLEPGRFRLASLRAYDLFPHTEHVEVLAAFDRT